jgi:hypothetical protein
VNFIKGRLRRLEESRHGACPECYQKPKTVLAYYPEQGESPPEVPTCPECGRPLAFVVCVVDGVLVDDDEGEGGTS